MTIILNETEIDTLIHDALCNGLGQLQSCDISLIIDEKKYDEAKQQLKESEKFKDSVICQEDVFLQMLKNDKLTFVDENDDEEISFTLAEAIERLNNSNEGDREVIFNILKEQGDANDACGVLEICLYKEIIFG